MKAQENIENILRMIRKIYLTFVQNSALTFMNMYQLVIFFKA
jgi:hypothetical protein